MKDILNRIEKLRVDAEDCALIAKLATVPAKREAFSKLAETYRDAASDLERVIASGGMGKPEGK